MYVYMSKQYIGCIYVCMLKKTIVHVYVLITVYTIQLYAFEKFFTVYILKYSCIIFVLVQCF